MTKPPSRSPLVEHLEALRAKDDRGALAALRRGLGRVPGEVASMYRHVVPWLPRELDPWGEHAHYLIAALFAMHPESGGTGRSLGRAMAMLRAAGGSESVERRFVALLDAHPEDLGEHLRHAVSLLRSKDIALDWHLLLRDVRSWTHLDGWVQRTWASDFWGHAERAEPTTTTPNPEGESA